MFSPSQYRVPTVEELGKMLQGQPMEAVHQKARELGGVAEQAHNQLLAAPRGPSNRALQKMVDRIAGLLGAVATSVPGEQVVEQIRASVWEWTTAAAAERAPHLRSPHSQQGSQT